MATRVDVNSGTIKWGLIAVLAIWFMAAAGKGLTSLFSAAGNAAGAGGNAVNALSDAVNGVVNGTTDLAKALASQFVGPIDAMPAPGNYAPGQEQSFGDFTRNIPYYQAGGSATGDWSTDPNQAP